MVRIVIAVDAMGGDFAPVSVIDGIRLALKSVINSSVGVFFKIYGREEEVLPLIGESFKADYEFIHVPDVISSDAKPSSTIRNGRTSSMYKAIESVKNGESDCVISAGNTGALVVLSRYMLGMLPGVSRPIIVGIVPCAVGDFVMLDLGANVDCNAESLFQFSVVGYVFAKSYFANKKIRLGLLNIGGEHTKGNDSVKNAFELISESGMDIDFLGYVEPSDCIVENRVDVVVVDGFSGNIGLKMSEAHVKALISEIKKTARSSIFSRFAMFCAKPFILKALSRFDPSKRNGAMLAGVNGVVIKSHGSAKAEDFAYALGVVVKVVVDKVNDKIVTEIGIVNG